jgi:hypothetical protein
MRVSAGTHSTTGTTVFTDRESRIENRDGREQSRIRTRSTGGNTVLPARCSPYVVLVQRQQEQKTD